MGRLDETRVGFEVINQPILIFAKLEEIILFRNLRNFAKDFGPFSIHLVFFLKKLLGPSRIKSLIFGLINIPAVVKILKQSGYHFLVPVLRGSYVVIIGNVQLLEHRLKFLRNSIATLDRLDSLSLSPLLYFLAMFVQARHELDRGPTKSARPSDYVGQHLLIGMTEMRRTIGIIDCRGKIESFHG